MRQTGNERYGESESKGRREIRPDRESERDTERDTERDRVIRTER